MDSVAHLFSLCPDVQNAHRVVPWSMDQLTFPLDLLTIVLSHG